MKNDKALFRRENMDFEKKVIEIIKKRKSIRSFRDDPIPDEDYKKIEAYLQNEENLVGPRGKKGRFQIVPVNRDTTENGVKIGTYGFIKNPRAYIVGIMENDKEALVEFGYIFEKLILYLTYLNIGTCWLGGTFNRNSFKEEIDLQGNEFIPCITPIGYSTENKRMMDKTIRFFAGSDNRKPWKDMLFLSDFNTMLTKEKAKDFEAPLEMLRMAPSASNKQPWRVLVDENKERIHFYLEHTLTYGEKLGFEIQRIDMGIAMRHFDLTCKRLNINGRWKTKKPKVSVPNEQFEYIITWEKN